jgi:hypothetical protein
VVLQLPLILCRLGSLDGSVRLEERISGLQRHPRCSRQTFPVAQHPRDLQLSLQRAPVRCKSRQMGLKSPSSAHIGPSLGNNM